MYNFQGSFEHAIIPIRFVFIVLRAITYVKVKWLQQLPQTFVAKTTGYNLLSWSWPLARPVWIHCSFYIRQSIVYISGVNTKDEDSWNVISVKCKAGSNGHKTYIMSFIYVRKVQNDTIVIHYGNILFTDTICLYNFSWECITQRVFSAPISVPRYIAK